MKAMILAAGRGERMRPLTDTTPKPLLSIRGKALIDYHIETLAAAGIQELVVNLSWHADQILQHVGDGSRYGVHVQYSDEGPEALGTGGGIHKALPLLGAKPFWIVNGDVYCEFAFPARQLSPGLLGHLVLVSNPPHNPAGDFSLVAERVRRRGSESLTYAGIALLDPELFRSSNPGKFPLAPLLLQAADAGALSGEHLRGVWHDVGTPERLKALGDRLLGPS